MRSSDILQELGVGGGARVGQYLGWTASGGLPGEVYGARPA